MAGLGLESSNQESPRNHEESSDYTVSAWPYDRIIARKLFGMESAFIKNNLQVACLLADVIATFKELEEEHGYYCDWAAEATLFSDDTARSYAILGAEERVYVYYSLEAEVSALKDKGLTIYYGWETVDASDDDAIDQVKRNIVLAFAGKGLNAICGDSQLEGIRIGHSKSSKRRISPEHKILASVYLEESCIAKYSDVFERYYPNECNEDNGDPADCVNIYLELVEGETVVDAVSRLLPEVQSSDIRHSQRCVDDGVDLTPIEQYADWDAESFSDPPI